MSEWGKILAPITVPTGGWDFTFTYGSGEVAEETVTVPAGTYATILHLCAALETVIDAVTTSDVEVSSVGIVTIEIADFVSVTWATTDDDLEAVLGLAGDEDIPDPPGDILTATNPHTHGWYPGIISYGSTRGEGIADDSTWIGEDASISSVAGDGTQTIIGPERLQYSRNLRFMTVHKGELNHALRGPKRLGDLWRYKKLYWYPDRDDGVVGTYGTQGDPGPTTYHDDATLDAAGSYHWQVTQTASPRFQRNASHPDWFSVDLFLNAEPD